MKKVYAALIVLIITFSMMWSAQAVEPEYTLSLPNSLKIIGEEAFLRTKSTQRIHLPDGITEIHSRAFAESTFHCITIPDSVEYIAEDAFDDCVNLSIAGSKGSYAEKYARENGIPFGVAMRDYRVETMLDFAEKGDLLRFETKLTGGTAPFKYTYRIYVDGRLFRTVKQNTPDFSLNAPGVGYYEVIVEVTDALNDAVCAVAEGISVVECLSPGVDCFKYEIENNRAIITGGYAGSLPEAFAFPLSIDGYPFTEIKDWAFKNENYQMVLIPENVRKIGEKAFWGCEELQVVLFAEGVEHIGVEAFSYTAIQEVVLPDSLKTLGDYAFAECAYLMDVYFGSQAKMNINIFDACYSLRHFEVSPKNPNYKSVDGVLFSKDGKTLIKYPRIRAGKSYTVPEGVETIGAYAFDMNYYLTSINLPDSLKHIENHGFSNMRLLSGIALPAGVEEIDDWAFSGCPKLRKVTMQEGVKKIGSAFTDCPALTYINFPKSAVSIDSEVLCDSDNAVVYLYEGSAADNYTDYYFNKYVYLK